MIGGLDDDLGLGGVPKEHVRLLTRVARMYYELGVRQPMIAEQLHISQSRVSRLLKQAAEVGIVRTSVVSPRGVHAGLEEQLEGRYGLAEVVVADTTDDLSDETSINGAVGSALGAYLETTLIAHERIGVSSWSSTLLAGVEAMRTRPTKVADQVIQLIGGIGDGVAQSVGNRLTGRLAQLTHAKAVYLIAPGLLANATMRRSLVTDPNIAAVVEAFTRLTVAILGIGTTEPSPLLRLSGNAVPEQEQAQLRELGAVGDVCMRYFDADGHHLASDLDGRVLGIEPATIKAVPRRIGVAGGERKRVAIRAAIRGQWLNVLVTDLQTAQWLIDDTGSDE